ncbi:TonB-dependent receptor [Cellvibrio mixtus]|uniref:TonB-dependent receptor n=1 Tax=Cellvibrio mixtus TaxID=39650 RepID=UPI000A552953|nr:TonB-dependent receptor [Cellvibrio mixtus]
MNKKNIVMVVLLTASAYQVQAENTNLAQLVPFNISENKADIALTEFAQQSNLTIIVPYDKVVSVRTRELVGTYSVVDGAITLLEGSGLYLAVNNNGQLSIRTNNDLEGKHSMLHKNKLSTAVVLAISSLAAAQSIAQDSQANDVEELIVTGFRGSLLKSLDQKRSAVNAKESIMAEDIGKFPDLNIAESIQRVPGVTISREGGEGRNITLRGFSPSFTRTTLNGMEVPAGSDGLDSGGVTINASRAFDFHVFASELFNRVDIQKSTTASMEEGGIAGTVDLYSAKPFDFDGFKVAASLQNGYNDLSEKNDPRLAFMMSNTFADDTLGALVSVAYSDRTVRQEGFGTVRWTTPVATNNIYPASANPVINGNIAEDDCQLNGSEVAAINCLWAPRLPRADYFGNDQERLGVTGSFQYRPSDNTKVTLDILHSELNNNRVNYNSMEWFLTHNEITPLKITVHPDGKRIMAGTYDDVESWIESRDQTSESIFDQYVLSGEFNLTDDLTLNAMVGKATNEADREEVRFYYISKSHQYSFDFSDNMDIPKVSWGAGYDYYDPENYQVTTSNNRSNFVKKDNLTSKVDLTFTQDRYSIETGIAYNDRKVESREGNGSYPSAFPAVGYTKNLPVSNFGKGLDGDLIPFLVADFDAIYRDNRISKDYTDNQSAAWIVGEETLAAFVELNNEFDVGTMLLKTNFGVRAVNTDVSSQAWINGSAVELDRSYKNFLPSMNFSLDVTDEVVTRLSYGKTMTRPDLGSLNIAAPSFGYTTRTVSNLGNPGLNPFESNDIDLSAEWYFADESLLAVNYFFKNVTTSLKTDIVEKLIDSEYYDAILSDPQYDEAYNADPRTVPYTHYIPVNDNAGYDVKGYELIYQQTFSFLPGFLSNLGVVSNYTHVNAGDMLGVSENSYNMTVFYEVDNYGVRVSANNRDDYLLSKPSDNGHAAEMKYGPTHFDLSSFYHFNDNLTFTFEAINLTDEVERIYGTGDGTMDMTREINHTGRQFLVGVRYSL